MGVTRGLVRSIFFRNKSYGAHDYNNGRSYLGEKKRWSSVRSYLCGDEFNSVLAVNDSESIKDSDALITMSHQLSSEFGVPFNSVLALEDSASVKHLEDNDSVSVKSSEATVTQPLQEEKLKLLDSYVKEDNQIEATETHTPKTHQTTPISKKFLEEDAAVIIQSAFRSYLEIRRSREVEESFSGEESQDKVSMGTSLEVQTCNSVKEPVFKRKRVPASRRTLQKNQTQILRIKEDWDDSTVSSTISESRIQSRIEAMTKRERALAYAFSQQLRICTKKKQIDRNSEDDANIGWSWLERWMATRVPDSIPIESTKTNIHTEVASWRAVLPMIYLSSLKAYQRHKKRKLKIFKLKIIVVKQAYQSANLFQATKSREGITGFRQPKVICYNRPKKLRRPRPHPQATNWEMDAKKPHRSKIAAAEIIISFQLPCVS